MLATALVIGNPRMDDTGWENHIKSLAGALPIMLGDPRKLSPEDLKKYRSWANWLHTMQTKYDIMSYRQDLSGFGEPTEDNWDGYQRINSETHAGGIVGVFNQGSTEVERFVKVQLLDPSATYHILRAPEGIEIGRMTGKVLEENGFQVKLNQKYDGSLFEISQIK